MSSRYSYTPEGFESMMWDLTRAIIDRAIKDAAGADDPDRCFFGDADSGYWFALDHARGVPHQPDLVPEDLRPAMGHYRLPPITRARASVEPAVLEDYLGDPVRTFDPWGAPQGDGFHPQGLYAKHDDDVRRVFECWDQLPDERDFWAAATALHDAVEPLWDLVHHDGPLYSLQYNLGIAGSVGRIGSAPEPMRGRAIEVLTHAYVVPLGGTLLQQAWLGQLLAAELKGLGDAWQTARRGVMEIGQMATDAMRGDATIHEGLATLSVLGSVMTVVGLIPAVGMAGAVTGVVLLGAQTVLQDIERNYDATRRAISIALSGADAGNVVSKVEQALTGLSRDITLEEGTAEGIMDRALGGTWIEPRIDPPDSYKLTFNLPGPEVVSATDAADFAGPGEIAVDLTRLRRAGGCLSDLATVLAGVATAAQAVDRGPAMWQRPDRIGGTGRDGAYDDFTTLHARLCWLVEDTAGELRAAGDHVQLAANALETSDDAADRALRDHARAMAGVTAPDPSEPPP